MGRRAHPFYYKSRKGWYATIHGKPNQKLIDGPNNSKTKKLAEDKFSELTGQSPEDFVAAKDSVAKICEVFLEDIQANKSAATHKWHDDLIRKFLKHYPSLKVGELKPYHVTRWVNSTPTNSVTTKRNKITCIKRVFKWAKKEGHITTNPIADVEGVMAERRDSYVSPAEFNQILSFVRNDDFRDLISTAFATGMRPQEILRCEARHFKRKEKKFEFLIKESKGKKRRRIVFIPDEVLKIVVKRSAKYKTGPIFRNTDGERWTPSSCGCQFSRLQIRMAKHKMRRKGLTPASKLTGKEAAKFQKRFCLYDFRHGFFTQGLEDGVDSLKLGLLGGHKDPSMVGRIYQHLDGKEVLRDELKKIRTIGNTDAEDERRARKRKRISRERKEIEELAVDYNLL